MPIFDSVSALLSAANERQLPLWQLVLSESALEAGICEDESLSRMAGRLEAMRRADSSYKAGQRSPSGLSGGDAELVYKYALSGESVCGEFIGKVLAAAVRMGECNACMHRIVAAPTAGSCGVLPAVLLPCAEKFSLGDSELVRALYVASGFGAVIANRASLSGAEAGCQAEIGSASAMAAAAVVQLRGGTNGQMASAAAFALKNMLGLVCDPVAGLVEVPCIKRNAAGAMNALTAAELALAGVRSRIPADEVIDAMAAVGSMLPASLRETGEGGLAATPTAVKFKAEYL